MPAASRRTRPTEDLKHDALKQGVAMLGDAIALSEPPAACFVLAQALFAWLQHPGDDTALVQALTEALARLGGEETPLFAALSPLSLRLGAPSVAQLASSLVTLLEPLSWSYEDGELLGALFEAHLNPVQRKKHGAFYTPRPIVDYLLDATLPAHNLPLSKEFRLLDPSCGAGNFLSVALEALFERVWTPQTGMEGRYLRLKRIMERHLFGVDLNPWAIRLAQIRLNFVQLKLVPELKRPLRAHLLGRDTLQEHDPLLEGGFDVIVGNPPYGAELSEGAKSFFQRHYRLGTGRQDTTALFIERSARLLRDRGRLGLVVPHGLTRTGAYADCRKLLVEDLQLKVLLDLGSAFPGVNLETMAFVTEQRHADRRRTSLPWAPDDRADVRLDSFRDGKWRHIGTQSHGFFRNRPTMPIYADRTASGWILKVEQVGEPLQSLATIRRGAGISAKEPALALGTGGIPVVRGRDIRRFGDEGGLLRLHPHHALRDRYLRDQLDAPAIVYQNIASAVTATLMPKGCLPLDTVNVLVPHAPWSNAYMLALLNSRLLEAYFQLVIANQAQLTLHLDTPTLGSLPIRIAPEASQRAIAHDVEHVLELHRGTSTWDLALVLEGQYWETPDALKAAARDLQHAMHSRRAEAEAILERVDAQVFELYDLTESESASVRAATPRTPRRTPRGLSKASEIVIVRGLFKILELSDRSFEPTELWRKWVRPDADVLAQAWGGDPAKDLADLLIKYGAIASGRHLRLWQPGLRPVPALS